MRHEIAHEPRRHAVLARASRGAARSGADSVDARRLSADDRAATARAAREIALGDVGDAMLIEAPIGIAPRAVAASLAEASASFIRGAEHTVAVLTAAARASVDAARGEADAIAYAQLSLRGGAPRAGWWSSAFSMIWRSGAAS